jgi:branched-chain amino acid transport system substrate-binding protein
MSRIGRLSAVAVAAVALTACPGQGPLKLGAVLPLTGPHEVYGQAIRKGVELAYEQVKADETAPKVELVVRDSASDPETAKKRLAEVYDLGAIASIGGVTSAEALAMVEITDDKRRVLLSPSASLPQLSGISENFFRVYPSDFSEGTVMARYAYDRLNLRTGLILAKEETYAKGIQQVFTDEFQRKGGKILETVDFPAGTRDFAALADRAVTLKPDFVYVAAYAEEASRLIAQLAAHQFGGPVLTTSSIAAAETLQRMGAAAEGIYFTQTSFDPDAPKAPAQVKRFVADYKARYGEDPDIYAAHGYDAFMILVQAIREGGDSALAFWKGMRNIHEYPGVTGALQFDDKGDVQKFPHVYIVRDGKAIDDEVMRQEQIDAARREMERLEAELRKLQNQGS